MTKEEFTKIVGREPIQDDLERVNCPKAGKLGHKECGVCKHGKPAFLCCECLTQLCEHPSKYPCPEVQLRDGQFKYYCPKRKRWIKITTRTKAVRILNNEL